MAIQKQEPLKGVRLRDLYNEKSRSWADLSIEERDAFLAKNPTLKDKSFAFVSNAYDNGRYIKEFGVDAFKANPDKASRDTELKTKLRSDLMESLYGDGFEENDDYTNASLRAQIANLSNEAFDELINSKYEFPSERAERLSKEKEGEKKQSSFLRAFVKAGEDYEETGNSIDWEKKGEKAFEDVNGDILTKILTADNKRTLANAEPVSQQIKSNLDQMGQEEFSGLFNELVKGDPTTGEGGIGLYKTFENKHEMKDFGPEQQKELIAKYLGVLETTKNPVKAQQAITEYLQDYLHNHQTAWDWWGSALSGIGTKAAGDFGNLIAGSHAIAGLAAYGEGWLNNYLQGLDENGAERGWWDNMKYWNGVDQYNTFDHDAIWQIEENGGISPYNWLSKAGNERNLSSALNEGMKMMGYTLAQTALSYGMGAGFRGLAGASGGIFSEAGALLEGSSKVSQAIMSKVAPVAISMVNAIPIATAYAKGSYDKVYQEATQRLEMMKEQELSSFMEESGLKGDELQAYYTLKKAELDEQYKDLEQEARMEATSAYERNATIEFARMSGVNYLFKDYLLDKSTRLAKNANHPGLQAVQQGEKIGMTGTFLGKAVAPKYARYYDMAKSVWGGFESNYMDDVTAAYSQGFSLGRYNNKLAQAFNPEKAVATSSWVAGITSALASAGEAFVDPQSWYDGLIGALGTIQAVTPRVGGLARGITRTGRTINQFNVDEIQQYANSVGLTKEQYVRGEGYDKVARKLLPNASEEEIAVRAQQLKDTYGFDSLVEDGTIKKLSTAERINNYVMNPLLQNYSDAAERERQFQNRIDAGNKAIETKKAAINDLINVVNSLNSYENALVEQGLLDAKEAKAYRAFTLVSTLDSWSKDPILSQSQFVQEAQAKIERLADGKITEEDINEFLSYNQNKSVTNEGNSTDIARQRLQENAKQLRDMQREYVKTLEDVKSMSDYKVLANTTNGGVENVVQQIAFNNVMYNDRVERIYQMSSDTGITTNTSMEEGNIAALGTESARRNYIDALVEQRDKLLDDVEEAQAKYDRARKISRKDPKRTLKIESSKLALNEARRRERGLRQKLNLINSLSANASEVVLSADEILNLNAIDRARMLNEKNRGNYSTEQKAEIDKAISQIRLKDPDGLQKIQDIATLVEMNRDLGVANELFLTNMQAAANYFDYMANQRAEQFENVLKKNTWTRADIEIDGADSDTQRIQLLKTKSIDYINHYSDSHPESKEALKPALDIAKLTTDIDSAVRKARQETINGIYQRTDLDAAQKKEVVRVVTDAYNKIGKSASDALLSSDAVDEQSAMAAIEEGLDMQNDEAVKTYYNRVLEEVARLGHQRDATVLRTREQKRREEEWKRQEAANKDGKNFGFDGYVLGDTIYHQDGRVGVVTGFYKKNNEGHMKVSWNRNKAEIHYDTSDLSKLSKTKPEVTQQFQQAPKIIETPRPQSEKSDAELIAGGEEVAQFTDEGKIVQKPEEQQAEAARAQSDGNSIGVPETSAQDVANRQTNVATPGLLEGNGIYRYDVDSLRDFGIMRLREGRKQGDSMNSFFGWLEDNHIQLQEIIDTELGKIIRNNPDTKVQFMIVNKPGVDKHVITVVEYTPEIEKIHDSNLGGVVMSNGTRYLTIGTLYSNNGLGPFMNVANKLRQESKTAFESGEECFVHPSMYTKVANIDAGRLVRQQVGEESVQYRTLGELFADPSRNPNGITFKNAIMGIMYNEKYFQTNGKEGTRKVFPPGRSESTLGRVFLMIPAANGNLIPVALKSNITIGELRDGEFKDAIYDVLRRIASPDLAMRQAAVAELNSYLVLDDNTNILVGNDKHNNVSIVRNGTVVYTRNVDATFKIDEFERAVFDTPFKVNITQRGIESPTFLEWLDEAGALQTDVSLLRTANAAYQVFEVNQNGEPIETKVPQAVPYERKEGIVKTGVATTVGNSIYRLIDGDYYDEFGKRVENQDLRNSIRYNLMIQKGNLKPVITSNKSGAKIYIISDSPESPIVVRVNNDGSVKIASEEEAVKTITTVREKAEVERRAKEAQDALEQLQNKALESGDFETVPSWDDNGVPPTQPQPAQVQKPVQEAKVEPDVKEEKPKGDPNKATRKSLSQLEADKKVTNFGTLYAQRRKELNEIAKEKGWNWGTTKESKESFLSGMGIDTAVITDVDAFMDMLKNCK